MVRAAQCPLWGGAILIVCAACPARALVVTAASAAHCGGGADAASCHAAGTSWLATGRALTTRGYAPAAIGTRRMRALKLAGGGAELSQGEPKTSLRSQLELWALIGLWYAASVICTNTTKSIGAHWSVITFSQLILSTLCGAVVVCGAGYPQKFQRIRGAEQLATTALLAAVFTMGFVTLNWALGMMHVSLVMTLRATEPMFTLLLASVLLRAEPVTWKMGVALLPVVAGAALSSAESAGVSLVGLLIVVAGNVCFALRGIITKRLKAGYAVDEFNLFLQISALGAAGYGAALLLANLVFPSVAPGLVAAVDVSQLLQAGRGGSVLVNGVTFYAYLQLSWVVLGRVAAVTHSVCNSMRRPVMCVAGWLQFGNAISPLNWLGITLASGGTLLYSSVADAETKRVKALAAKARSNNAKPTLEA